MLRWPTANRARAGSVGVRRTPAQDLHVKWFTRLVVVSAIIEALEEVDLAFPPIDAAKRKEFDAARVALASESG